MQDNLFSYTIPFKLVLKNNIYYSMFVLFVFNVQYAFTEPYNSSDPHLFIPLLKYIPVEPLCSLEMNDAYEYVSSFN